MPAVQIGFDGSVYKICPECERTFNAPSLFGLRKWFYQTPRNKDGLSYYCKSCQGGYAKARQRLASVAGRKLSGL